MYLVTVWENLEDMDPRTCGYDQEHLEKWDMVDAWEKEMCGRLYVYKDKASFKDDDAASMEEQSISFCFFYGYDHLAHLQSQYPNTSGSTEITR